MPTEEDREELVEAIKDNDSTKIRELLQRDDAKELLLVEDESGYLPIRDACYYKPDSKVLQLILDAAVEHGIIKQMLEAKVESFKCSFLTYACESDLSTESFCVFLGYLSKYCDLTKMLEEKDDIGTNCLHHACTVSLSTDSLRLLISFFPSKEMFENALVAKSKHSERTPVESAKKDEIKQLLQDPDCWQKCRLWLLQNYEETFLHSLHPNSFEKTCQALQEVTENGLEHCHRHATIILIALMTSPSKFRESADKTTTSAPMSRYFDVVKKGDKKSDYNHWRKNVRLFREFYGRWPPSERKTATTFEGEDSSSCVVQ